MTTKPAFRDEGSEASEPRITQYPINSTPLPDRAVETMSMDELTAAVEDVKLKIDRLQDINRILRAGLTQICSDVGEYDGWEAWLIATETLTEAEFVR